MPTPTPESKPQPVITNNPNISKVMLNMEPAVSPTTHVLQQVIEIDSRDLPSITSSSPANTTDEPPSLDSKTGADSSDEEKTNIYNIRTGKPITIQPPNSNKPNPVTTNNKQTATVVEVTSGEDTPKESTPVHLVVESPKSPIVNKSLTIIRDASEPSSRAESPLWTYTLPAPPKFADSEGIDNNQTIASTDHPGFFNGGSQTNSSDTATVISDLSDLSDVPIKPIIKERLPLDFQVFNDASTVGEDVQSVTASDVEDGYQGYSQRFSREALLESLERRREQFIENEFKFLTTEDSTLGSEPHSLQMDTTEAATTPPTHPAEQPERKETTKIVSKEVSRQLSRESTKSNVIDELKDVISNHKLDAIIKSNGHDDQPIAGCDQTALSNFSINSYTHEVPLLTTPATTKNNQEVDFNDFRRVVELHITPNVVEDTEAISKQPNHFIKRPSLTNGTIATSFKSPTSRINRSDSFHSTRQTEPPADHITSAIGVLTPRSSSYISLIGTQKFENRSLRTQYVDSAIRRNSSSELSIADSPSLQSLSVMKSILSNSRKNSLNNEAISSNEVTGAINGSRREEHAPSVLKRNTSVTDINRPPIVKAFDADVIEPTPIVLETLVKSANVTVTQLNADPQETDASNVEKKWRYQGPPAINMSTWGERPKSKICIKTDKDYKSSDTAFENSEVVHNESADSSQKTIVKNESITVRTVDNDRTPIILGVVPKAVPVHSEPFVKESNIFIRRPSYEISTYVSEKPNPEASTIASNTMTLGRVPIPNRWSTIGSTRNSTPLHVSATNMAAASAVTVKSFKVADPVNNHISVTSLTNSKNYAIAKDGSFDSGYKSMPPVYSELAAAKLAQAADTEQSATTAPFSQFTLRKTGLKDKILADSTVRNISSSEAATVTTTVQLRSQHGETHKRYSVPVFTAPPTFPKPLAVNVSRTVVTAPPPTPPSLSSAPVVVNNAKKSQRPVVEIDSRDQLLDAIRNFSKNGGLKKKK